MAHLYFLSLSLTLAPSRYTHNECMVSKKLHHERQSSLSPVCLSNQYMRLHLDQSYFLTQSLTERMCSVHHLCLF